MNLPLPKTSSERLQFLYAILITLLLLGVGSFAFWITDYWVAYPAAMLAFLILGILHIYVLSKWFSTLFLNGSIKALGFTLLLGLLAGLVIVLLYHKISDALVMGVGMASALIGFLFPVFVAKVYQTYLMIPVREYKKWYYPMGQSLPDMDLLDLSRVLVIQFEFTKKADETAFTNFRAKAPNGMLFGELFFIFLNDYNERNPSGPVEFLTPEGNPYGWLFYKKSPWYKRRKYMDPDLTFQANSIVDNETIVAIRE